MHPPFADKKLDAGREFTASTLGYFQRMPFFMSCKKSEQKLIRNTYRFFVREDAELFQRKILRTYNVVDYVIRESEIQPVYGRQDMKVSGVEYYILDPQVFE